MRCRFKHKIFQNEEKGIYYYAIRKIRKVMGGEN